MNILFAGSSKISCYSLSKLFECKEINIVGVLTQPEKKGKRHNISESNPVKKLSFQLGIPTLEPEKLDSKIREDIRLLSPTYLVCVSYGKIFGPKFLALFDLGINLHPSLLPLHRGPSPIQSSILSGDVKTGVSIQKIGLQMDAGDILNQKEYNLKGDEYYPFLEEELGKMGADMLVSAILNIDNIEPKKQDDLNVSYCYKIEKSDYKLENDDNIEYIYRKIRAYYPNTYFIFDEKKLFMLDVKIKEIDDDSFFDLENGYIVKNDKKNGIIVKFKDGILFVKKLKLQFKKELDNNSFLNGNKLIIGNILK